MADKNLWHYLTPTKINIYNQGIQGEKKLSMDAFTDSFRICYHINGRSVLIPLVTQVFIIVFHFLSQIPLTLNNIIFLWEATVTNHLPSMSSAIRNVVG